MPTTPNLRIFWRQKEDVKQIPYNWPTNITRHCTKCSSHGDLQPGICAPQPPCVFMPWTGRFSSSPVRVTFKYNFYVLYEGYVRLTSPEKQWHMSTYTSLNTGTWAETARSTHGERWNITFRNTCHCPICAHRETKMLSSQKKIHFM